MRGIFFILFFCMFFILAPAQVKTKSSFLKSKKIALPEIEIDPIVYQNHYFSALRYKALGNLDLAEESLLHCIEMNKEEPSIYYEFGLIKYKKQEFEEGIYYLEIAVKINPKNRWYRHLLSNLYLENQEYSKAITSFKKLLLLDKNNPELYFEIATAYLLHGQPRNAIKYYDLLEEHIGFNERLSEQKKKIYLELGDNSGAIKELVKWSEIQPRNLNVLALLSELYLLEDREEDATQTLERVLNVDPENGRALLILSETYRRNQQEELAFKTVKKAFKSTQLAIDSKMRILISNYDLSEDSIVLNQSFELIDLLIEAHPTDAKSYTIAGDYFMRTNQMKSAVFAFKSALDFDASRFPIWQQLLVLTFDLKNYDEAIEIAEEALELFPSQPILYYLNGLSHLQLDNCQAAIDLFKKGKIMVVANPDLLQRFYTSLGDAFYACQDFEESDKAYEKSLELKPDDVFVLNNYSYYLSLRGVNLEKAKEMMRRCIELKPDITSYEDTYAWVFYKLKEYDKAFNWINKAINNGGDKNPVILEHYGDILFQVKQIEKALEQWRLAKDLGSESELIDQKIKDRRLYE